MIVLICGDRNWTDEDTINEYIKTLPPNSTIVHGNGRGADKIADRLGRIHGHEVIPISAEWNKYKKGAAGPIRNKRMLEEHKIDLVVAFHNDLSRSKGTKDMLRQAEKKGILTEHHTSTGIKGMKPLIEYLNSPCTFCFTLSGMKCIATFGEKCPRKSESLTYRDKVAPLTNNGDKENGN